MEEELGRQHQQKKVYHENILVNTLERIIKNTLMSDRDKREVEVESVSVTDLCQ